MAGSKEKKGESIRSRLILLLLFILVPVLALQAYIYYDTYQSRRASELQANLEIARAVAKSFESYVQDIIHMELAIGLAITSSQPMRAGDIARLLEAWRDYDAIRDFTWMNPEGVAIYSSNPAMVGNKYNDRGYFSEIANGREWTVGELVLAKTTGKPVFGISRGIRDVKGALLGVVVATVIPEQLDKRLAVERSKGSGLSLVDHKGMLVYRYPAIDVTWEERNWLKQYPEYEEVLKGKEIATTVYAPYEGKTRLVGFTPVSDIGWAATAGKREEDVTGPILSSIAYNAFLFLVVSFAAFFIALALSRRITRPVTALRAHALALGQGVVPEQVKINHIQEFQELAEAFNTMAEQVRDREQKLRLVTDTVPALISYIDPQFHYRRVNKGYESWFGLTAGEMEGRHVKEVLGEEAWQLVRTRLEQAIAGETVSYEEHMPYSVGRPRWTYATLVPDRDSSGRVQGLVELVADITERKQAEEVLRFEREQLLSLFDSMDSLIYVTDPSTYEILYMNKAMENIFGRRALGGICYREFQGLETPCPFCTNEIILRQYPAPHYWEYYNPKVARHFSIIDRIIRWPDGRNVRFEIATDITEHKRAEEALRKAKEELEERVKERTYELYEESLYARSLIEASLDPLVTISVDGKITDVNRASEEVTGVSREELIGSDFSDYFTEPEKARAGYEEVFQQGIVRDYPLELKRRDGHVTPVLYNATLYRDETGRTMGVFAAARDITEIKRAEESVKAERQRLYDVLEKLPVYTILLTPDYQVPFANRFFRERFGESHGKRCYEYLFNRMEPCEICETFTVQKTGKRHHWEWTGPDGRNYDIFDFPFTDFDGSSLIMEVGIDITERKQAEASLRSLASELVMAEERERKRIAGVLHDEVAQTLAAAKMHIDMLKGTPSDQEQTLEEAKALLLQSIQETRALMTDIGNPLLFDMGLKAACESIADRLMESHSVRIICDIRDTFKHVNPDVKTILYQLIRELLNNVVKHSQARNAHVLLDMENGHFRVKVTDDGVGFDPQTPKTPTVEGGFGLYSIQERLSAIGGSLRIESAPGSGTMVTAILPAVLDGSQHRDNNGRRKIS